MASHVEVAAFIRLANQSGDFATVLKRGDSVSGALLLIGLIRGQEPKVFERFPSLDGDRTWEEVSLKGITNPQDIEAYVDRRRKNDPDLWVIELDVAAPERLNRLLG